MIWRWIIWKKIKNLARRSRVKFFIFFQIIHLQITICGPNFKFRSRQLLLSTKREGMIAQSSSSLPCSDQSSLSTCVTSRMQPNAGQSKGGAHREDRRCILSSWRLASPLLPSCNSCHKVRDRGRSSLPFHSIHIFYFTMGVISETFFTVNLQTAVLHDCDPIPPWLACVHLRISRFTLVNICDLWRACALRALGLLLALPSSLPSYGRKKQWYSELLQPLRRRAAGGREARRFLTYYITLHYITTLHRRFM